KVRAMGELRTELSLGLDSCRPLNHDTIRCSAIMRCDLLGPLKWRIARPSPANCVMRKSARIPPIIEVRHVDLGGINDSVQRHHFVVSTFRPALRARSIIADDVDEQRV